MSGWDGDRDPLLEPTAFNDTKEEVGLTQIAAALQEFYCEISLTHIFKTFPLTLQMREHYYYSYCEHNDHLNCYFDYYYYYYR